MKKFFVVEQAIGPTGKSESHPILWGPFNSHAKANAYMQHNFDVEVRTERLEQTDDTDPSHFTAEDGDITLHWFIVEPTSTKR